MNENASLPDDPGTEVIDGFILKMNFKRTWGIIQDGSEREYYFNVEDANLESFILMEGMSLRFMPSYDTTANPANLTMKATEIEITDERYDRYRKDRHEN